MEGIEIVEKAKAKISGQAKYDKDEGRIFMMDIDSTQCWLDEKID